MRIKIKRLMDTYACYEKIGYVLCGKLCTIG